MPLGPRFTCYLNQFLPDNPCLEILVYPMERPGRASLKLHLIIMRTAS